MTLDLKVFGEFQLQVTTDGKVRTVESKDVKAFVNKSSVIDIIESCGCYVFCMKHGEKLTPWYVGKTTKTFKQECFTPHKIAKYNKALAHKPNATAYMFFISSSTGVTFSEDKISDVEQYLIKKAIVKNKKLLNTHYTAEPQWRIIGAVRAKQGESSKASSAFSAALGLKAK